MYMYILCINIFFGLLGDHEPSLMEFLVHHNVFRNQTRSSVQVSSKRQADVLGYTLNEVHKGSREWEEGENQRVPRTHALETAHREKCTYIPPPLPSPLLPPSFFLPSPLPRTLSLPSTSPSFHPHKHTLTSMHTHTFSNTCTHAHTCSVHLHAYTRTECACALVL